MLLEISSVKSINEGENVVAAVIIVMTVMMMMIRGVVLKEEVGGLQTLARSQTYIKCT